VVHSFPYLTLFFTPGCLGPRVLFIGSLVYGAVYGFFWLADHYLHLKKLKVETLKAELEVRELIMKLLRDCGDEPGPRGYQLQTLIDFEDLRALINEASLNLPRRILFDLGFKIGVRSIRPRAHYPRWLVVLAVMLMLLVAVLLALLLAPQFANSYPHASVLLLRLSRDFAYLLTIVSIYIAIRLSPRTIGQFRQRDHALVGLN
jgi:hypothetical protein